MTPYGNTTHITPLAMRIYVLMSWQDAVFFRVECLHDCLGYCCGNWPTRAHTEQALRILQRAGLLDIEILENKEWYMTFPTL